MLTSGRISEKGLYVRFLFALKSTKMRPLVPRWRLVIITFMLMAIEKAIGQGSLTDRSITVHKSASKIVIDGELNEEGWQGATIADSFINKWPTDMGKAKLQTEIKILYDGQFIYFGIKAILGDKTPVIQSLKRDVNPYYSDGVSVVIDPSGEHTSGILLASMLLTLKWKVLCR